MDDLVLYLNGWDVHIYGRPEIQKCNKLPGIVQLLKYFIIL